MDHEGCRHLYNDQRKKYVELKKNFISLRSSYLKLKESHDSCMVELELLRKENENLKHSRLAKGKSIKLRETLLESDYEEQFSHFLLKQPSKVSKIYESGRIKQVHPDQSVQLECNESFIYQGFFIVGPSESQVGVSDPLTGQILHEYYPGSISIGQNIKSIIPTLCFPCNIFIESFDERKRTFSPREKVTKSMQKCKEFVITVKNENLSSRLTDLPNSDHELLYVICIEFEEILENSSGSWWVPKCYCIGSFIPAFDLHFSVLRRLVYLRTNTNDEIKTINKGKFGNLNKEEELLIELYKECEELFPSKMIQFGLEECGFIRYLCPKRLSDVDVRWAVVILIQHLISDDFLWIVFAIAQEKSIVFVSSDPGTTSACVLALHCLLRPLKWPNLMVPLVPSSLMELLEAPIPILAGVNYIYPNKRNELDSIIWVMLDEKNIGKRIIKFNNGEDEVVIPAWPEGVRSVKTLYPTMKDTLEVTPEMIEKAVEIKSVVSQLFSEILDSVKTGQYLPYGKDFLESVINTQMFSVTAGA